MSSYKTEIKAVGLSFRHVTKQLKKGDKVELIPEPDNQYDPNALAIKTLDGTMLGYVGKTDPLRSRLLEQCKEGQVILPVLVANYYEKGKEKLWKSVEVGDMVQLWLEATGEKNPNDDSFTELTSFTGEQVLWSESLHVCTDLEGNKLLGGSTYASQFEKDFNQEVMAKNYAAKHGMSTSDVLTYWKGLADISMDYGTAIHRALEHYSRSFRAFGHEAALPRQTFLREAVKAFLKVSNFNDCVPEPLITDIKMGMSGWVDNLRLVSGKKVVIEDYKTNTFKDTKDYPSKWEAKLKNYHHQLNFYGTILSNHGYEVVGLVVWHYHEGKWNINPLDYTPVKEYSR